MVAASAPGKLILYGEHAVVFGEPALSVAISRRTRVVARSAGRNQVNGHPLEEERYRYVAEGLRVMKVGDPLSLTTQSDIPMASGMGSSAAVTVALLACLQGMRGSLRKEEIARMGFEVEHAVQGRASPIDTTTATHGGGILLLKERGEDFLWDIEKGPTRWNLHSAPLPDMTFVVGSTGIEAATGPLVAQVRRRVEAKEKARDAVQRIGEITLEGVEALRGDELERGGELMLENHRLLNALGVGHESRSIVDHTGASGAVGPESRPIGRSLEATLGEIAGGGIAEPPSIDNRDHRPDVQLIDDRLEDILAHRNALRDFFDQSQRAEINARGDLLETTLYGVEHRQSVPQRVVV